MNGPNNPIGWCDYTWNPVAGCLHACTFGATQAVCYAEGIAKRFAGGKAFPHGFAPTFHPERLQEPSRVKTPARIFVSSMGDLFGGWVPREWIDETLSAIRRTPWHTFICLTKAPWVAQRYVMPDNVWLGTTITGDLANEPRRLEMARDYQARVRFLSVEPLAGPVDVSNAKPDWVIIGAATGRGAFQPEESWVVAIEQYADGLGIPIYHKDNLTIRPEKRHEWPDGHSETSRLPCSCPMQATA